MPETREDIGYHSEMPSQQSQEAMRRYLEGNAEQKQATGLQPTEHHEWKISEVERNAGRSGIADTRAYLLAKQKLHDGLALSGEETALIEKYSKPAIED